MADAWREHVERRRHVGKVDVIFLWDICCKTGDIIDETMVLLW